MTQNTDSATEIFTAISHEREPHCIGCWKIVYEHIRFGDSTLHAVCNECGERRPIVLSVERSKARETT